MPCDWHGLHEQALQFLWQICTCLPGGGPRWLLQEWKQRGCICMCTQMVYVGCETGFPDFDLLCLACFDLLCLPGGGPRWLLQEWKQGGRSCQGKSSEGYAAREAAEGTQGAKKKGETGKSPCSGRLRLGLLLTLLLVCLLCTEQRRKEKLVSMLDDCA